MTYHPCLNFWGTSAQVVRNELNSIKPNGASPGWAKDFDDESDFDALRALYDALYLALGSSDDQNGLVEWEGGAIDAVALGHAVETMLPQLEDDRQQTGGHPTATAGWLTRPFRLPAAQAAAFELYLSVRDAVDTLT